MLSTNTVEGNGTLDDGITTKVRITHQPVPQMPNRRGHRLPEPRSPPFADATDSDENSDEYVDMMNDRIPNPIHTNHCSNQSQKRYCSLQCYKAAEPNNRYM